MTAKKSRLKGCLLTCGIVFLVFILLCAGFTFWLFKKGKFDPDKSILDANTTAYARAYLTRDDEVLTEFMVSRLREIQEQAPGGAQMPDVFKDFQNWKSRNDIRANLPVKFEIDFDLEEGTYRGALSYSRFANMIGITYGFFERAASKDNISRTYRDYRYVAINDQSQDDDPFFLDLVDRIFYFADTEPNMHRNYDAMEDMTFVHPETTTMNTDAPVYGFLGQRAILWMLQSERISGNIPEGLTNLTASLDLVTFALTATDKDTLAWESRFRVPPSEAAKQEIQKLAEVILKEIEVDHELDIQEQTDGYRVTVTMRNFSDASGDLIRP